MNNKTALILVDLQNDFCAGGRLAVPDADAIMPLINKLQAHFDLVVATKDWHRKTHQSFADNHPTKQVGDIIQLKGCAQVLWPLHCVQDTKGADFHPELDVSLIEHVCYKGCDDEVDSYSGFFDNARRHSTGLAEFLHAEEVKSIYIVGLATNYCVKFTCLDGVHLGFDTYLITDACRGVELSPGDINKALDEMQSAGVKLIDSQRF